MLRKWKGFGVAHMTTQISKQIRDSSCVTGRKMDWLNSSRHKDHAKRRQGAVLREIEAYWDALREDREMPHRAEVDPRGFQRSLRHSFILERMAPGHARIRIAGSLLSDIMGMEVAGMPVTSLVAPSRRSGFQKVLEEVFSGPARARLNLSAERGMGKPDLSGEMLLLPMRSTRGDVTRVLGGLEVSGHIGSRPRRFCLESSFLRELRSGQPVRTTSGPPASLPRTVATGVSYLRLVVNTP